MAIFNSYVTLPEGNHPKHIYMPPQFSPEINDIRLYPMRHPIKKPLFFLFFFFFWGAEVQDVKFGHHTLFSDNEKMPLESIADF